MLGFGLVLLIAKLVWMFFDPFNIMDTLVFVTAGILLGGKIPTGQKALALLLALPAVMLCLFFVVQNGYKNIVNGQGTSYAISLIVIPLATMIGVYINKRRGVLKGSTSR